VLDILRTMGFELIALSISKGEDGAFRVDLSYEPQGSLADQTFIDRIAGLSAISTPRRVQAVLKACA
jgi:hypothetical protein